MGRETLQLSIRLLERSPPRHPWLISHPPLSSRRSMLILRNRRLYPFERRIRLVSCGQFVRRSVTWSTVLLTCSFVQRVEPCNHAALRSAARELFYPRLGTLVQIIVLLSARFLPPAPCGLTCRAWTHRSKKKFSCLRSVGGNRKSIYNRQTSIV